MFENLIRERPEVMTKIIPVLGDVSLPLLGISQSDLQLLISNVSLIFNSAATVRFNEDLRTSVQLNVKGPQELLRICRQMKHLDVIFYFIQQSLIKHFKLCNYVRLWCTYQRPLIT